MHFRRQASSNGFTIIEVVLVLAIAGLIFMAILLTLPQLQRVRRDNQRKSDLALFESALLNYAQNNALKYPRSNTIDQFVADYFIDYADPSTGQDYEVLYRSVSATVDQPDAGEIIIDTSNAACSAGSNSITNNSNASFIYADPDNPTNIANRQYAIAIGLEQGYYCIDNSG